MQRRVSGLFLGLALAACDAIHDGAFEGVPALAVEGRLVVVGEAAAPVWGDGERLVVQVRWETTSTPGSLVASAARVELRFPDGVRLIVPEPPPASARTSLPGMSAPVAFGQLVAFEDLDGNDAWSPVIEPLYGVSTAALVFAEEPAASARMVAPAGFSFQRLRGCHDDGGFGGVPVPALRVALYPEARAPYEPASLSGRIGGQCAPRATYPCQGLAERRSGCLEAPDSPACRACPLALYPVGATVTECELWRNGCAFHADYDPDECESQWRACVCATVPTPGPEPCDPDGVAYGAARP